LLRWDGFSQESISPVFHNWKEVAMTLMLIEDTLSEEEAVAQQFAPTVKMRLVWRDHSAGRKRADSGDVPGLS